MGATFSRTFFSLLAGGEGNVRGRETKIFAYIRQQNWSEVRRRARDRPHEVSTWLVVRFPNGSMISILPLHIAVTLDPPPDVVETLVKAWSKGLMAKETMFRRLALHLACTEGASADVVRELLKNEGKYGSQCRDKDGMLPIHLACLTGAPIGVVELLLKSYPQSVMVKDGRGKTPLKIARLSKSKNKMAIITTISHFMNINAALSGRTGPKKPDQSDELPETSGSLVSSGPDTDKEMSQLARLVLERKWDDVIDRCNSKKFYLESRRWITSLITLDDGTEEEWRRLPLHEACRLNAPRIVVEALCKASRITADNENVSGVLSTESWYSRVPLHIACSEDASVKVIKTLLQNNAIAATLMDKEGNLPLHLAYLNGADTEVIALLLQAYPEGIFVTNYAGSTPLALVSKVSRPETTEIEKLMRLTEKAVLSPARSEERKDNVARIALDDSIDEDSMFNTAKYTDLARSVMKKQWDAVMAFAMSNETKGQQSMWIETISKDNVVFRRLPINQALSDDAPEQAIMSLIRYRPEDVRTPDSRGRLPLHIALDNEASLDIIQALIEIYPEATSIKEDIYGMLPIHIACTKPVTVKLVESLLQFYIEGAAVTDNDRCLPLHYAIRKRATKDVIQFLHEAYSSGTMTEDANGWLPLHLACWKNLPSDVILSLFDSNKEAASRSNSDGWLPIHFAAETGLSEEVFVSLLTANPYGIEFRTNSGLLPLAIAKKLPAANRNKSMILGHLCKTPQDWGAPPDMPDKESSAVDKDYAYKTSDELDLYDHERNPVSKKRTILGIEALDLNVDDDMFFTTELKPRSIEETKVELGLVSNSEDESDEESDIENEFNPPGKVSLFTVSSKLIERYEWDGLISRSNTNPDEIGTWFITTLDGESWCCLPLHKALMMNPPITVIAALISAYPDGVQYTDNLEQTPLYIACKYKLPCDIIRLLVENIAIDERMKRDGEKALHVAMDANHPDLEQLVELLNF